MDNQHEQISGYRDLTQDEIDTINEIKAAESRLGEFWQRLVNSTSADGRWMSIARTHFEEGFSALVRAVAKPESRF